MREGAVRNTEYWPLAGPGPAVPACTVADSRLSRGAEQPARWHLLIALRTWQHSLASRDAPLNQRASCAAYLRPARGNTSPEMRQSAASTPRLPVSPFARETAGGTVGYGPGRGESARREDRSIIRAFESAHISEHDIFFVIRTASDISCYDISTADLACCRRRGASDAPQACMKVPGGSGRCRP